MKSNEMLSPISQRLNFNYVGIIVDLNYLAGGWFLPLSLTYLHGDYTVVIKTFSLSDCPHVCMGKQLCFFVVCQFWQGFLLEKANIFTLWKNQQFWVRIPVVVLATRQYRYVKWNNKWSLLDLTKGVCLLWQTNASSWLFITKSGLLI